MDKTTIFPDEQTMWNHLWKNINSYATSLQFPKPYIPKQIWNNDRAMYEIFKYACEKQFGKNTPKENYDNSGKYSIKSYIRHLPKRMQSNYNIICTGLRYGLTSKDIPENLRNDQQIAFIAAKYSDIDTISNEWKNNEHFAYFTIEYDPTNVVLLSDSIRKKINADKLAINIFENRYHTHHLNAMYSHLREFLTDVVYKNASKKQTIYFIKSIGWSNYASKKYENDIDVLKTIIKYDLNVSEDIWYFNNCIINHGPFRTKHLSNNELAEIYLAKCTKKWGRSEDDYYEYLKEYKRPKVSRRKSWYFTKSNITNNSKIMLKYIKKNPYVINIISPALEKDIQFASQLCSIYGPNFEWSKYARKPLLETIKQIA